MTVPLHPPLIQVGVPIFKFSLCINMSTYSWNIGMQTNSKPIVENWLSQRLLMSNLWLHIHLLPLNKNSQDNKNLVFLVW